MKTIGLIGGTSWVSTVDYYKYLNEMMAGKLGGATSAKILLYSVDFAEVEHLQSEGDWDALGEMYAEIGRNLQTAGADCLLICANTMHKVAPALEAAVDIPLIHIVDATAAAVKEAGLSQVSLLGTRYTMELPFFSERLASLGVTAITPSDDERTYIHDKIYGEMTHGQFLPKTKAGYLEIIHGLAERGAQGAILGCTEIPMLIKSTDTPQPIFDTTWHHCKAAVEFALAD